MITPALVGHGAAQLTAIVSCCPAASVPPAGETLMSPDTVVVQLPWPPIACRVIDPCRMTEVPPQITSPGGSPVVVSGVTESVPGAGAGAGGGGGGACGELVCVTTGAVVTWPVAVATGAGGLAAVAVGEGC